jgi:hypothetical protein
VTTTQNTYERPTAARLKEGVGHLQYECVSLYKQSLLSVEMQKNPRPAGVSDEAWDVLKTTLLESWLVHVRGIMMACRERRGRGFPDDVLFRDYLTPAAWQALRGTLVPDAAAEERIQDIGLFLAHISYRRADSPLRARWHIEEFVRLDRRIRAWYEALEPEWRREFSPLGDILKGAEGTATG